MKKVMTYALLIIGYLLVLEPYTLLYAPQMVQHIQHVFHHSTEQLQKLPHKRKRHLLIKAAKTGNLRTASRLLTQQKRSNNTPDQQGVTPLMYAAAYGHSDFVKLLLNYISTQDALVENSNHETALTMAVWNNHLKVVQLLLPVVGKKGALNPNTLGEIPLMQAIKASNPALVKLLLEAAPEGAFYIDREGQTMLMHTLHDIPTQLGFKSHSPHILTMLIAITGSHHADITDSNHETILLKAIYTNNRQIVKTLLNCIGTQGACFENSEGLTPLIAAILWNRRRIVQLLLPYVSKKALLGFNRYGNNALMYAAHNNHPDILQDIVTFLPTSTL